MTGMLVSPFAVMAKTNVVWKSSAGMGITHKSGNTDKTLYTFYANVDRRTKKTSFLNDFYAEYGETEGEKTEASIRYLTEWRKRMKKKWFFGVNGDLYHDGIKDIDCRIKIGPAAGYYFINKDRVKLDGSLGAVIVYEKTDDSAGRFGQFRLAERLDWKFSETASYYFNTEWYLRMDDVLDNQILVITGVKAKMNSRFSLFVELRDEYDSVPEIDDVEHNDITVIAGVKYDIK